MGTKLTSILLTILSVIVITGIGTIYWNYPNQTIYAVVVLILILFVRHIYTVINYYLNERSKD